MFAGTFKRRNLLGCSKRRRSHQTLPRAAAHQPFRYGDRQPNWSIRVMCESLMSRMLYYHVRSDSCRNITNLFSFTTTKHCDGNRNSYRVDFGNWQYCRSFIHRFNIPLFDIAMMVVVEEDSTSITPLAPPLSRLVLRLARVFSIKFLPGRGLRSERSKT